MKIGFFDLENWEKERFSKEFIDKCDLIFFDESINKVAVEKIKDIDVAAIFIYSQMDKEMLDKLPNLKFIATMSMGVDHIDLQECKKRNIVVSNVPVYGENTVAEHAFALILALSRKIIDSYKRIKEWQFDPEGLTGFDLSGKTIGVVGVGNIGKNVVKIAKGFGMDVLGWKRTPDPDLEKALDFKLVDLDVLYSQSDIITLHVPCVKETQHMINKEAFEKMKDGVMIINTSRGVVIDTNALLEALNSGKVSAAGLDVLEGEPLLREEKEILTKGFDKKELLFVLENHLLAAHPNVLITPHNAFNSKEALNKIVKTTEENIEGFLSGNIKNLVS